MFKDPIKALAGIFFWLPMVAFTALIIQSSLPYFTQAASDPFFLERPHLANRPLWRAVLYIHILGGICALLSAVLQFSKNLLRLSPKLHRLQGRLYVWSVLVVTVPTGLYLAYYAKGGAPGRIGFGVQGVLLFYATWTGLRYILEGKVHAHVAWMTRSYAIAATAISFRLWYIGLWYAGWEATYVPAIWLSTLGNLLVCEAFLTLRHHKPSIKGLPA